MTDTVRDVFGTEHPLADVQAGRVLQFLQPGRLYKLMPNGAYRPSIPPGASTDGYMEPGRYKVRLMSGSVTEAEQIEEGTEEEKGETG